jgi:hypothetical protein
MVALQKRHKEAQIARLRRVACAEVSELGGVVENHR